MYVLDGALQYMGPSLVQIGHLFVLIMANSFTLFAVGVLLVRTIWSLAVNTTTIEGWEIDRHRALLRRARILGGYVYGPDGIKVPMKKQEFPYDIGIWRNFKQGMGGSGNVRPAILPFLALSPIPRSDAEAHL
jgi:palmitoyltransferase